MNIYVIRHGQTKLNVAGMINGSLDDELTSVGIEQAIAAAHTLPKTITHMYVSSLERAKQTARYLNSELQVPVTYHDELKEVNFGRLNGTPYLEEFALRHKMVDYDWHPSGENVEDVKKRVLAILKKIKEENEDGQALIVAHGGIVRMLYFLETNGGILDEIGNTSLHSFDIDKILSNNR